jgi:hypothetical protein
VQHKKCTANQAAFVFPASRVTWVAFLGWLIDYVSLQAIQIKGFFDLDAASIHQTTLSATGSIL